MKIEIELTQEETIKLKAISHYHLLTKKEYLENLIKKELANNIYLEFGYIYDRKSKTLIKNNEVILLNNLENQLFNFLINNLDKYVSNDEIISNVIKSKSMSIFSMRNLIKSIREKTMHDLIIRKNNVGYKLNSLKLN